MTRPASIRSRGFWCTAALLLILPATLYGWLRTGLLDLPSLPANLTAEATGLADLDRMRRLNALIWSDSDSAVQPQSAEDLAPGAALVRAGIAAYRRSGTCAGLEEIRQGLRLEPNNLVFANAYRMVVFALRREFLASARQESLVAPKFPPELDGQPIRFFEELDRDKSTRETKLHLALAWVDEMLLFPALEIKAPASAEAVNLLTAAIEQGGSDYVPALFARGLNHLHRPARLVWPESTRTPREAAAQDLRRCIAIGRRLGVGSPRLQGALALDLGDAYVKAGRISLARSWWQIAQNQCKDADLQGAIRRRYAWQDEEILDRLEEELDRSRSELGHPMTDLALMWN